MGRKKIRMVPLTSERARTVTFQKRKFGLFKKAFELSILTGAQIGIIMFNNDKLVQFSSNDMDEILLRYTQTAVPDEIRTNEDFEALRDDPNSEGEFVDNDLPSQNLPHRFTTSGKKDDTRPMDGAAMARSSTPVSFPVGSTFAPSTLVGFHVDPSNMAPTPTTAAYLAAASNNLSPSAFFSQISNFSLANPMMGAGSQRSAFTPTFPTLPDRSGMMLPFRGPSPLSRPPHAAASMAPSPSQLPTVSVLSATDGDSSSNPPFIMGIQSDAQSLSTGALAPPTMRRPNRPSPLRQTTSVGPIVESPVTTPGSGGVTPGLSGMPSSSRKPSHLRVQIPTSASSSQDTFNLEAGNSASGGGIENMMDRRMSEVQPLDPAMLHAALQQQEEERLRGNIMGSSNGGTGTQPSGITEDAMMLPSAFVRSLFNFTPVANSAHPAALDNAPPDNGITQYSIPFSSLYYTNQAADVPRKDEHAGDDEPMKPLVHPQPAPAHPPHSSVLSRSLQMSTATTYFPEFYQTAATMLLSAGAGGLSAGAGLLSAGAGTGSALWPQYLMMSPAVGSAGGLSAFPWSGVVAHGMIPGLQGGDVRPPSRNALDPGSGVGGNAGAVASATGLTDVDSPVQAAAASLASLATSARHNGSSTPVVTTKDIQDALNDATAGNNMTTEILSCAKRHIGQSNPSSPITAPTAGKRQRKQ